MTRFFCDGLTRQKRLTVSGPVFLGEVQRDAQQDDRAEHDEIGHFAAESRQRARGQQNQHQRITQAHQVLDKDGPALGRAQQVGAVPGKPGPSLLAGQASRQAGIIARWPRRQRRFHAHLFPWAIPNIENPRQAGAMSRVITLARANDTPAPAAGRLKAA
jgi:hypothetical protein